MIGREWFAGEFFGAVVPGQHLDQAAGSSVVQEATPVVQASVTGRVELGVEQSRLLEADLVGMGRGVVAARVAVGAAGGGLEELLAAECRFAESAIGQPVWAERVFD